MPKVQVQGKTLKITVVLLLVTGLAAFLRFYDLDGSNLRGDESFTLRNARENALSIVAEKGEQGGHPPFWWLFTHLFLILGEDAVFLRFPAVLFGIASVPLAYVVGKRILGEQGGVVAAVLLATSPTHINQSQMARMYGALLFFSLWTLYSLYRALQEEKGKWWALFVLSTLFNIYNHYFALFVLAGEMAFSAWVIARRWWGMRKRPLSWPSIRELVEEARGFICSLGAIGLFYLPWLPMLRTNLLLRQTAKEARSVKGKITALQSLLRCLKGFAPSTGTAVYLYLALFIVGILLLMRRSREETVLLITLWIIPPFLLFFLLGGTRKFNPRYVLYILPIYLLVIAYGLTGLGGWLVRLLRGRIDLEKASLAVNLSLSLLLLVGWTLPPLMERYGKAGYGWEEIAGFLGESVQTDDAIIVVGSSTGSLLYYESDLEENIRQIKRSLEELERIAKRHDRVWFVYAPSGEADERKLRWAKKNLIPVLRGGQGYGKLHLYFGRLPTPLSEGEIIPVLEKATEFFVQPGLHCQLGQAYQAQGDDERALAEYNEGLRLDPTNKACLQGLKSLSVEEAR